jgi:hypothetical protein
MAKLDKDDIEVLGRAYYPDYKRGIENFTDIGRLTDGMGFGPNALASHALNRIGTWLDHAEHGRWQGDAVVAVTWDQDRGTERSCIITETQSGRRWKARWFSDRRGGNIEISALRTDGSASVIASGEIAAADRDERLREKGYYNSEKSEAGSVHGWLTNAGDEDFFDLSIGIGRSMSDVHRKTTTGTATAEHVYLLREELAELLERDGGMPGRLASAYLEIGRSLAFQSAATDIAKKAIDLAASLTDVGAVWGNGYLEYSDLDHNACVIPMGSGAPAFFHNDRATAHSDPAYIAWIETVEREPARLCVLPLNNQEDYPQAVKTVQSGAAKPSFSYDFKRKSVGFGDDRRGFGAMALFLWNFHADVAYAVSDGTLKTDAGYFREVKTSDAQP